MTYPIGKNGNLMTFGNLINAIPQNVVTKTFTVGHFCGSSGQGILRINQFRSCRVHPNPKRTKTDRLSELSYRYQAVLVTSRSTSTEALKGRTTRTPEEDEERTDCRLSSPSMIFCDHRTGERLLGYVLACCHFGAFTPDIEKRTECRTTILRGAM